MASGRIRLKQETTRTRMELTKIGMRGKTNDPLSLPLASSSSQGSQIHSMESSDDNTEHINNHEYEDLRRYSPGFIPHNNTIHPEHSIADLQANTKRKQTIKSTECWEDSNKDSWVLKVILVIVLVVSLTSLILVVLNVIGVIGPKYVCSNKLESTKPNQANFQPNVSIAFLLKRIDMLEKNISSLVLQMKSNNVGNKSNEGNEGNGVNGADGGGGGNDGNKDNSTSTSSITNEVRKLRDKQAQFDSSLTKLKASDKTKATEIQEMSAKVIGLAVAVNFLSLNDSLIKSKVHKLSQSEVEFRSSIEALKQKDAEVDTSLRKAINVEAFLNTSVNQLKSVDGQMKNKLNQINTTFMTKLSQSEVEFRSSIEALKQKYAEVDTSLKRARSVEAFLNSSVNQLKSVDGQMKNKLDQMNSTFMTKINSINSTINKIQGGGAGTPGPPGPQGPRGIPGTPGAGNLSQCQHQQKKFEGTSMSSADYFVNFIEPKDKFVVGATCSTVRGDETNLASSTNSRGEKVYVCTCRGQSNFVRGSGTMKCLIDVWVCPRIT